MKPKRSIQWTVSPEKLKEDRTRKAEIRALPAFRSEPIMKEETRKAWDEIGVGSGVVFVSSILIETRQGHPLKVIERHHFGPLPAGREGFAEGAFGVYIGMTPVKMRRNGTSSHIEGDVVEREFRTFLIGHNKYLLDDPNLIRAV